MESYNREYIDRLREQAATAAVAEELRLRRVTLGLGLRTVAREAGIDSGNLSRYEHGIVRPRAKTFQRITAAIFKLGRATK